MATLGRNLEQRSSLKQLVLRCPCLVICGAGFTLKDVCELFQLSTCWAWGPELFAAGESSKCVVKGTEGELT